MNSKLIKIKLINSYIPQMDAEEPSPTERTQQVNQNCDQKIMSSQMSLAISYLLSQNQQDRQKGKDILLRYQNSSQSELLMKIILAVKFASTHQDKHYCLLFLRDKLAFTSDQDNIPNLTLDLGALISQVPEELRSLATQCMNIYLNRLQVEIYKEEYLYNLIKKVEEQVNQNSLSESLIQTFTDMLSQPERTVLCFFFRLDQTIKNILEKCGSQQVTSKKWLRFMITLMNIEGYSQSASAWSFQFVYRNLVNKEATYLGVQQILRLTQIFNEYPYKFKEPIQMNEILQVQLQRVKDKQFMLRLNKQFEDEDSFGKIIKSIENAINYIYKARRENKNASALEIQIFNKILNPHFLVSVIDNLFSLPDLTTTDKVFIYQLCNNLILNMSLNLSRELFCSTIDILCQYLQVKGQNKQLTHVYELMGNIDPTLIKYFPYLKVIQFGFKKIVDREWPINAQYLKMVIYCLKNLRETAQPSLILPVVGKLIKYCLEFDFSARLDFRSLVFVVICEYLPKSVEQQTYIVTKVQEFENQFKLMLTEGFLLLKQLLFAQEIDEVTLEDVFEGMWHACVYQKNCSELAHNYFQQFINTDKNPRIINLHLKFLGLISQNNQNTQNQNIGHLNDTSLLIIQTLFQSNQDIICQQCCSIILRALIQANKHWSRCWLYPGRIDPFLHKIFRTKLINYIQYNLKKKNDDPLFCKILLELTIHKAGSKKVKPLLQRVVNTIYATEDIREEIQYNFDRVWEVMVILYGERNDYVEKKGIIKRVENLRKERAASQIKVTNFDTMLYNLKQTEMRKLNKKNWSSLPDVSKVISADSIVGWYIENKICFPG